MVRNTNAALRAAGTTQAFHHRSTHELAKHPRHLSRGRSGAAAGVTGVGAAWAMEEVAIGPGVPGWSMPGMMAGAGVSPDDARLDIAP